MTKNKIEEKTAQKKQGKVVSTPAELFLREQFEYFLQFADSLSEDEVVYYKKFGMIMGRHYDNIQRSITCDQFCLEADKLNVNIERDPINTLRAAMEGFLTELHLQDRHFTIEESLGYRNYYVVIFRGGQGSKSLTNTDVEAFKRNVYKWENIRNHELTISVNMLAKGCDPAKINVLVMAEIIQKYLLSKEFKVEDKDIKVKYLDWRTPVIKFSWPAEALVDTIPLQVQLECSCESSLNRES
jgi:hypothetical protein